LDDSFELSGTYKLCHRRNYYGYLVPERIRKTKGEQMTYNTIAVLDLFFFLASLFGLIILLRGYKKALTRGTKLLLSGLQVFIIAYSLCLVIEWSGITTALDTLEDFIGALIPMWWAFVFYSFTQESSYHDLQQSEEKFRRLVDNLVGSFLYRHDTTGVFNFVSSSITQVLGYSEEEFLTHFSTYLTDDPVNKKVHEYTELSIQGMQQPPYEVQIYHKDGSIHWLEVAEVAIRNEQGNIIAVEGIAHDVTERKRAEELMRSSEEKYRVLFEGHAEPVTILDRDGIILMVNAAGARNIGLSQEESVGKSIFELLPEIDDSLHEVYQQVIDTGISVTREDFLEFPSGHRWFWSIHQPVSDINGTRYGVQIISYDITERKRAEEELQKLAAVVRHSTELVNLATLDGKMIFLNEAGSKMLGIDPDEVEQTNIMQVIPEHLKQLVNTEVLPTLKDSRIWEGDVQYLNLKTGKLTDVHAITFTVQDPLTSEPLYLANVSRDITDRKQAREEADQHQAEAAHAGRLSSIGEMASALAHELNQPLCAILTHAEGCLAISRHKSADMEKLRSKLSTVAKQAELAGAIISRIRGFTRKGKTQKSAIDLNEVIREVMSLIHAQVERAKILIEFDPDEGVRSVPANRVQIEQVILNLVRNSVDAMQDAKPANRKLTITTSMTPENTVEVIIRDRGKGIDKKNVERIFQPFFTTKPEGLGLGLSISQSIVESHSGRLYVKGNSDKGATFCLVLPAIPEKA
jgi:two-component system sensor kinase FixL